MFREQQLENWWVWLYCYGLIGLNVDLFVVCSSVHHFYHWTCGMCYGVYVLLVSVCLFVCLFSVCVVSSCVTVLLVSMSVRPLVCVSVSVCLCMYLFVCLYVCVSVCSCDGICECIFLCT